MPRPIDPAEIHRAEEGPPGSLELLAFLKEAAFAAAASRNLKEMCDKILLALHGSMDVRRACVHRLEDEASNLALLALLGDADGLVIPAGDVPLDNDSLLGRVLLGEPRYLTRESMPAEADRLDKPWQDADEDGRWIALPLKARGRLVGAAILDFSGRRPFAEEEIWLCRAIAAQLGVAIENAQLHDAHLEAQRQAKQELETTKLLLEAANALADRNDLGDVMNALADIVLRSTSHKRVSISKWDTEMGEVRVIAARGESPVPADMSLTMDQLSPQTRAAVLKGRSALVEYDESGHHSRPPRARSKKASAALPVRVLHVPLMYRGRLVGNIAIDDPGDWRDFTQREIQLVEGIAAQAAVAFENARLFEQERQERRLGQALGRLDQAMHSSLEFAEIAHRALLEAVKAIEADVVLIGLNEDGGTLQTSYSHGWPDEEIKKFVAGGRDAKAMLALQSDETITVTDTSSDPRVDRGLMKKYKVKSLAVAPLRIGGEQIGGIYFAFRDRVHHFGEAEVEFVSMVASSLSLAFENAQLYEAEVEAQARAHVELQTTNLLLDAADSLAFSLDIRLVYETVARISRRFTNHGRVCIGLFDRDDAFTFVYAIGDPAPPLGARVERHDWIEGTQEALRTGRSRILEFSETGDGGSDLRAAMDIQHALFVPLVVSGRTIGILSIDQPGRRKEFSARQVAMVEGLGSQAAVAIENARMFEREREAARLGEALAKVDTDVLSSLDVDEIVGSALAEGAKAIGAESALIAYVEGSTWRARWEHGDAGVMHGVTFTNEQNPQGVLAIRTGRTVAVEDGFNDPRVDTETTRMCSLRSQIVAPLVVRGEATGAVHFNYHSAIHRFTEAEIEFVRKVASSLALAIENARLYEAEHRVAETLQSALLALPETVPGVHFAQAYHSAAEAARVGGDFYDLFELDRGLLGITVGDISGKGLDAAVLTSLVKNTLRAQAIERRKTPAQVLESANLVLYKGSSTEVFATVFFGILDRDDGRLVYCNAGHTTVAIAQAGGGLVQLPATSPFVGAFTTATFKNAEAQLAHGDLLFLYTDGLVEARSGGVQYGEPRLFELLAQTRSHHEPSKTVSRIIGDVMAFAGGTLNDDLAVLALQRHELAS